MMSPAPAGRAQRIDRYQEVWWDRALVACQALAGDGAKAALGLAVLAEQKAPTDPAFDALIDALAGRAHKIDKLGAADAAEPHAVGRGEAAPAAGCAGRRGSGRACRLRDE